MGSDSQAPTLDARKVAPHRVDLPDRGPATQQRLVDGLLLLQCQPWRRQRHECGTATGNQSDNKIILGQPGHRLEHTLGSLLAQFVRHGMRSFQYLNVTTFRTVSIPGNNEAGKVGVLVGISPRALEGRSHCRRRFASPNHDGTSGRARR